MTDTDDRPEDGETEYHRPPPGHDDRGGWCSPDDWDVNPHADPPRPEDGEKLPKGTGDALTDARIVMRSIRVYLAQRAGNDPVAFDLLREAEEFVTPCLRPNRRCPFCQYVMTPEAAEFLRDRLEEKARRPEDGERGEAMPCPFCGREIGEADTRVGRQFNREHEYYIVVCPACGACGPEAATEDGALASWNLTPRHRTGAGEDVTDAARLALRWFKTWGANRHGPKLDNRSVVAVLEDALCDRPDPSTRSEGEECICGHGFGMNLSCPVHSTHADPAPTGSERDTDTGGEG